MFKLLKYFSISSAIVIVLLGVSVGHLYQWYQTSRMIASASAQNEAIANKILPAIWHRHAQHLTATTERDAEALKMSWQTTDIDLAIRAATVRMAVAKVDIYSPTGQTLYSSDLADVGSLKERGQPAFVGALKGRVTSRLTRRTRMADMSGATVTADLVATLLPHFGIDGRVVGVVEVYADVTAATRRIEDEIWPTTTLSLAICLLLYLSLYAIVARADRYMKAQYGELQGFSSRLESEVGTRTSHMLRQQRMLGDLMRSARFQSGSLDQSLAALSEAATEILQVDRCGVYVPAEGADSYAVIDVYDRRTKAHSGRFEKPASYFLSGRQAMEPSDINCVYDIREAAGVDRAFIDYYRDLGITSAMDLPIYLDGRQAGILCVRHGGDPHHWGADERLCAGAIATLAALVMQRIEREKAETSIAEGRRLLSQQQTVLTGMAREVCVPADELADVLRPMLRQLTSVLGIEISGIWLLDSERANFTFAEIYTASTDLHASPRARNDFNLRALDLHRSTLGTIAIDDVRTHPLLAPYFEDTLKPLDIVSLLRAPIVIDGELAGVISCAATKQQVSWSAEQSLFATGVASVAALAIERYQRRKVEAELAIGADALSRQQAVLNELLNSESFRNGSLSASMRRLSRTFALEAGIDRVAIIIRSPGSERADYAETFVSTINDHVAPFAGAGWGPENVLATARSGRTIVADDVYAHPDLVVLLDRLIRPLDIGSFMMIPIEVGGTVVGMLNASTCGRRVIWSTRLQLFATALANLAALTIERHNRQRYERAIAGVAARLESQQAAITDFMREVAWQRGGLTEAMQKLTAMASATLGVERVSIWRMSEDRRTITAFDAFDSRNGQHSDGVSLSADDHPGYFKGLIEDGVIAADDVYKNPRLKSLVTSYFPTADVYSMLDMAIMADGAPIGVVCAEKCGEAIAWSEEHRLFISAIANLAALMMERHERQRIEDEVNAGAQRLWHQLETINALIHSDIVRHGSLQQTMQELSRVLCRELAVDRVALLLGESRFNDVIYDEVYVAADDRHVPPVYPDGGVWPQVASVDDVSSSAALEDVTQDAGLMRRHRVLFETLDLRSLLQVPIRIDGVVTGAIRASTIGRSTAWRTDQQLLATAVAQLAALAVERSNRQRVERDLRHANIAAEQANRAKSQFLANMSHEIRTPMNGVFGMTELLMKSRLTTRQRRHVGTIHESAKTLLTVINDILDLSRIEDGKLTIDLQPFDLHQCLESSVELFAEEAQRRGLELNVFIAPETPAHVIGDAGRLRQVCVNLLSNALKFTKFGSVSLRVVSECTADDVTTIRFEVADTGIGVDPGVTARLFQPFMQADSSITRRFGGTGLGLSISRHLVGLMGGAIAMDSEPGRGTRVAFTLPLSRADIGRETVPIGADVLAGRRVLVVDDRDSNREIMVDYLSGVGASPVNARNSELALDLLKSAADAGHPFDVAIVDMLMPDMDGLTLCRTIRADARIGGMGLVMVTSMTWDGDAQAARELGLSRLLTKPVRRGDLIEAAARAVVEPMPSVVNNVAAVSMDVEIVFDAHVLLAEDNPVNEEVARELLLSMGCTVHAVANGRSACAAFEHGRYDLVLMDCQMPEMDGLTATQRMRQIEAAQGRLRTPIVAVTAHAFEADRAACHAVGMDDYLMKPFTEHQLRAVLERWLSDKSERPGARLATAATMPDPEQTDTLDASLIADLRKRRPQLLERLLAAYLTHSPVAVAQLLEAAANRRVEALYLAAHSLKSSSANVGAKRVAEIARRIEMSVRAESHEELDTLAAALGAEFSTTQAAMTLELERIRHTA